jgi:hypothetical protein
MSTKVYPFGGTKVIIDRDRKGGLFSPSYGDATWAPNDLERGKFEKQKSSFLQKKPALFKPDGNLEEIFPEEIKNKKLPGSKGDGEGFWPYDEDIKKPMGQPKPTNPGESSYLDEKGTQLLRIEKERPSRMQACRELKEKFGDRAHDIFQALFCVKQMYKYPEATDFVNLILLFFPYNSDKCKDHAKVQKKLFEMDTITVDDFRDDYAKMFPNYLYMGTPGEKKLYTPDDPTRFYEDRTISTVMHYPIEENGKLTNADTSSKETYNLMLKRKEDLPKDWKDWWGKSLEVGKKELLKVYQKMTPFGKQARDWEEMDRMFFYLLITEIAYEDFPFDMLQDPVKTVKAMNKTLGKTKRVKEDSYKMRLMMMHHDRLRKYKPLGDIEVCKLDNKTFSGLFGGRQVKECTFIQVKKYWEDKVSKIRTPVDEVIRQREMIEKKEKKDPRNFLEKHLRSRMKELTDFTICIPRYFIAENTDTKEILIAVRGTKNFGEAIMDLKSTTIPTACNRGRVHLAFQLGAIMIAADIYPHLKQKMKPGYTISLTGHSLGAACASLVAILLETPLAEGGCGFGGRVQCYGYGCPALLNCNSLEDLETGEINFLEDMDKVPPPTSENTFLADTEAYITTFVNQHDLVPRLAPQNIAAYVWGSDNTDASFMDAAAECTMKTFTAKKSEKDSMLTKGMAKGGGLLTAGGSLLRKASKSVDEATGGAAGELARKANDAAGEAAEIVKAKAKKVGRGLMKDAWEMADVALMALSRDWGTYKFDNLWLPGKIYQLSYEHLGVLDEGWDDVITDIKEAGRKPKIPDENSFVPKYTLVYDPEKIDIDKECNACMHGKDAKVVEYYRALVDIDKYNKNELTVKSKYTLAFKRHEIAKHERTVGGQKKTVSVLVEPKKMLCLHQVPRNHPRVCWINGDPRMFSDHLTDNPIFEGDGYIANLAQLYYACERPKIPTKSKPIPRPVEEASGAGCGCVVC